MTGPEKSGSGDGKKSGGVKMYAQAESMLQLAIALPIGCAVGWLLGSWADRAWHQNWIAIFGVILGAVGGFLQIYKIASAYLKDGK